MGVVLRATLVMRAKGRMFADTAVWLTELQSRIRPHFLFDTLNSATALVRAEPAKAETLLESLSDLFRHALIESSDFVTLVIEKVGFGERLRMSWALDASAEMSTLPPLLLQLLV